MVVEKKAGEQEMRVFLHNFLTIKNIKCIDYKKIYERISSQ